MKSLVLACAALFFAQSALADTVEYKCEITKTDSHGWIAPEYYFQIDTDARTAQALSRHHDWTRSKLKMRSDGEYRLLWNVTLRERNGQNLRMKYQANLDTSANTVRVRASFAHVSASNKPFGSGVCKIFTG